jgi:hypothetical protein
VIRGRKLVSMSLLSSESQPGTRRVRGREKRNITLNTKLTRTEYAEVEHHCESLGLDFGEWLRGLVLRELRGETEHSAQLALMGEITNLRLLLINTLEPLLRGDKMTAEQFKEMLRYVKANKRKAAEDTFTSYKERSTEQR